MKIDIRGDKLDDVQIVGDRVLIRPLSKKSKTQSGLYLPPTVSDKEELRSGYVIKVGPGYQVPSSEADEPWDIKGNKAKYMSLQANVGDLVVFLSKSCWDIELQNDKYVIAPHGAILMLVRDEGLFS
ncbi:MAG: co-chaperone GroES [Bacteroidales bacterium]